MRLVFLLMPSVYSSLTSNDIFHFYCTLESLRLYSLVYPGRRKLYWGMTTFILRRMGSKFDS